MNRGFPSESWMGSAGSLTNQSQYFIANTTKLYIPAIILKLRDTGQLIFNDKISTYIPSDAMNDLHIYKGVDYSDEITIKHSLSHTSGLPDYFEQKKENVQSLKDELISVKDKKWIFRETIKITKKMNPHFKPEKKRKAYYSDTNYQYKPVTEFIGHSGLSGAFAYYCTGKDVYLTGTVNQIHNPG